MKQNNKIVIIQKFHKLKKYIVFKFLKAIDIKKIKTNLGFSKNSFLKVIKIHKAFLQSENANIWQKKLHSGELFYIQVPLLLN